MINFFLHLIGCTVQLKGPMILLWNALVLGISRIYLAESNSTTIGQNFYFELSKKPRFNYGVIVMVFDATFNNISVISWQLEKATDLQQITDKLYHIVLYWVHFTWVGFKLLIVVIGSDCISSCKANYYAITTVATPGSIMYLYGGPPSYQATSIKGTRLSGQISDVFKW